MAVSSQQGDILRFVRLSNNARIPTRASREAAGLDLYSAYNYYVLPRERALVKTDVQVAVPDGCYGRVAPRSGLALHHQVDVAAGVLDPDYRGDIGVLLVNNGTKPYLVKAGDKVAQLILEKACFPVLVEAAHLEDTTRGSNGFGSSGM